VVERAGSRKLLLHLKKLEDGHSPKRKTIMLVSHIPSSDPYRFESDFCISFAVTSKLMSWCLSAMNVFWRSATFLWSALRPVRMWPGRPCKRGNQQSVLIASKLASELTPPSYPPQKKIRKKKGKQNQKYWSLWQETETPAFTLCILPEKLLL